MPAKFSGLRVEPGDVMAFYGPSGGGYGDPLDRPAEKVLEDVLDEFYTSEAARSTFGVVVDLEAERVDEAATEAARRALRARPAEERAGAGADLGPVAARPEAPRPAARSTSISAPAPAGSGRSTAAAHVVHRDRAPGRAARRFRGSRWRPGDGGHSPAGQWSARRERGRRQRHRPLAQRPLRRRLELRDRGLPPRRRGGGGHRTAPHERQLRPAYRPRERPRSRPRRAAQARERRVSARLRGRPSAPAPDQRASLCFFGRPRPARPGCEGGEPGQTRRPRRPVRSSRSAPVPHSIDPVADLGEALRVREALQQPRKPLGPFQRRTSALPSDTAAPVLQRGPRSSPCSRPSRSNCSVHSFARSASIAPPPSRS